MTEERKKIVKKVIDFIKNEYKKIQMFDSRNVVGDECIRVYSEDGVKIYYCYHWNYIEILGLSREEFEYVGKKCGL